MKLTATRVLATMFTISMLATGWATSSPPPVYMVEDWEGDTSAWTLDGPAEVACIPDSNCVLSLSPAAGQTAKAFRHLCMAHAPVAKLNFSHRGLGGSAGEASLSVTAITQRGHRVGLHFNEGPASAWLSLNEGQSRYVGSNIGITWIEYHLYFSLPEGLVGARGTEVSSAFPTLGIESWDPGIAAIEISATRRSGAASAIQIDTITLDGGAPHECTGPTTPRGPVVRAGPGRGEVTYDWTHPDTNGGIPLDGYDVYEVTGGTFSFVATVLPQNRYTVRGLGDGEERRFAVSARNAVDESPLSSVATGKAPTLPSAPRNLTHAGSRLYWEAPTDDGGVPLYYEVHTRTLTGETSVTTTTQRTNYDFIPFYDFAFYKVRAVNVAGVGPFSEEICASGDPQTAPACPQIHTVMRTTDDAAEATGSR